MTHYTENDNRDLAEQERYLMARVEVLQRTVRRLEEELRMRDALIDMLRGEAVTK